MRAFLLLCMLASAAAFFTGTPLQAGARQVRNWMRSEGQLTMMAAAAHNPLVTHPVVAMGDGDGWDGGRLPSLSLV